jgi:hypothetical protein
VAAQRIRRKKGVLGDDQIGELDDLAFDWDAQASSWNSFFEKLKAFKERFGHCNVETGWKEDKVFARWAIALRGQRRRGTLSEERIARLNELGFVWEWNKLKANETWMKWYRELETYMHEHGNPHVPRLYANVKLGSWVMIQRARRGKALGNRPPLTTEQVALLDKLGFRWDAREEQWDEGFEQTKRFKEKHGHFEIEQVQGDESELSRWVTTQRRQNSSGELQAERKAKLDSIGFVWTSEDKSEVKWQEMYARLKLYHVEHGDADVPNRWKTSLKLAAWVGAQRQRRKQGKIPDEQIRLLDELGFTWQHRERGLWEDRLAEIVEFKAKHGHCKIPVDKTKLGHFVNAMRTQRNNGKLSAERIAKLDTIGFAWAARS